MHAGMSYINNPYPILPQYPSVNPTMPCHGQLNGVIGMALIESNPRYPVTGTDHVLSTFVVVRDRTSSICTNRVRSLWSISQELVTASPGQRNWRGIFIALLVIAAVLGLIVFSIFLLSPTDEGSRIKGERLTLADVIGDKLKPRPVNASWISGE